MNLSVLNEVSSYEEEGEDIYREEFFGESTKWDRIRINPAMIAIKQIRRRFSYLVRFFIEMIDFF